jgi:predicted nucleotidyltransferase
MLVHYADSIHNVTAYFEAMPEVQALLLAGSVAHGLAGPASDIDVLILVSEETYAERAHCGRLHFFNRELCTYPGGYVDGKYLRPSFLDQVARCGSEPARFAFADAQILFSHLPGLDTAVARAAQYPTEGRSERMQRFYAQFEAWHWYAHEALKRANPYLLNVAVSKLVLFGGRLILAHNHLLYPYHKWFLQQLERAPHRPSQLLLAITRLQHAPTPESVTTFYDLVREFHAWPQPACGWPTQFMLDSEQNWLIGATPVDDL